MLREALRGSASGGVFFQGSRGSGLVPPRNRRPPTSPRVRPYTEKLFEGGWTALLVARPGEIKFKAP